jgi:CBS domain containing-hemolysin-like protein
MMSFFYNFLGLCLLLFLSAFFSGSETALSALSRIQIERMRAEDDKHRSAVIKFVDEPRRLFITVLFGNTLVNLAFISITGSLIYETLFRGQNPAIAYIVAILLETGFLLIFGEITPKTFAIKHAESLSRIVAPPLWIFSKLIYPFRRILRLITDLLLPYFGVRTMVDETPITNEEIRSIVRTTEDHGALDEKEEELLLNIIELHDTKVKEIMVPRVQMVCTEVSKTIQEAFKMAKKAGHSRLPVYRKDIDNICGIFNVKDIPRWKDINLAKLNKKNIYDFTLDEFLNHQNFLNSLNPENENTLIRAPFFVHMTRDCGSLLAEMTKKNQQMALILDEFGGVSGMVTAEDIVEEVVGEIVDEYDNIPPNMIIKDPSDPSSYLVSGATALRSVNKHFNIDLDLSAANTVGGYVISLLGAIPKVGESRWDSSNDLSFEVLKMKGKRIDLVKIQPKKRKKGKSEDSSSSSSSSFFLFTLLFVGFCAPFLISSGAVEDVTIGTQATAVFIVLLTISLILNALYSGSETAVVSATRSRINVLAQYGDKRAKIIQTLHQEPNKMLGIVLVGTNLTAVAAGVAGLRLTHHVLRVNEELIEVVNTFILTLIILVFCEILPKTIFRAKADDLALKSAYGLRVSSFFLYPIASLVTKITDPLIRMARDENREEGFRIMREELKLLAKMGEEEGALKKAQLRMIHSILDLERRKAGMIMTPMVDIVAVPERCDYDLFLKTVAGTGFSRIPVYKDRFDNFVGLINVLDVLYEERRSATIDSHIQKDILLVPKSKHILPLLRELISTKKFMAFVVDEYGGVVGLITIEDLVEEILGDIRDERDIEEDKVIRKISDRVIDCEGKAEIFTLNQTYDLSIPEGDYETLAGYLIENMQRIAKKGENFETDDLGFLILDADERSIKRVRILIK